jgi:hypothetical protein
MKNLKSRYGGVYDANILALFFIESHKAILYNVRLNLGHQIENIYNKK